MPAPTVLVIDPCWDSREISSTILRHVGFRVLSVEDPDQGLEIAALEQPDVVVTELFRRAESRWHCLERLTKDPRTRGLPVIALSVYARAEDAQRAREAGAIRFLDKPVPPSQLVAAVRRVLARRGADATRRQPVDPPAASA